MQHAVQGRSVRSAHLQDVDSAAARAVPLLDKPGPATGPYFPIEDVHVTQRTDGLRNANERAGAARGSGAPFWAVSSFWFICTRGAASGRLEQRGGRGVGGGCCYPAAEERVCSPARQRQGLPTTQLELGAFTCLRLDAWAAGLNRDESG